MTRENPVIIFPIKKRSHFERFIAGIEARIAEGFGSVATTMRMFKGKESLWYVL